MKLLKNERFENNVECPKRKININAFDFVPNRRKIGLLKYHEHTTMTTITTTTAWAYSSANSFINRLFIIGFLGHNFVDAVCFMQFAWKFSLSIFFLLLSFFFLLSSVVAILCDFLAGILVFVVVPYDSHSLINSSQAHDRWARLIFHVFESFFFSQRHNLSIRYTYISVLAEFPNIYLIVIISEFRPKFTSHAACSICFFCLNC